MDMSPGEPSNSSTSSLSVIKCEDLLVPKCEFILKSEHVDSPPQSDSSEMALDHDPLSCEPSDPKTCPFCSKPHRSAADLSRHILIHTGELPFSCPIPECEKRFNRKTNLNRHLKSTHGSESDKQFQCSFPPCTKKFLEKYDLIRHERTHTGEKPLECQYCGKKFRERTTMRDHLRSHTGVRPFQCQYCTKSFSVRASVYLHERTHTGSKPFPCSDCDKQFHFKKHLEEHMNVHRGIKPYKCSECSKTFHSAGSRNGHQKLHFGPKKRNVIITGI